MTQLVINLIDYCFDTFRQSFFFRFFYKVLKNPYICEGVNTIYAIKSMYILTFMFCSM
jgi:hypothetical protein